MATELLTARELQIAVLKSQGFANKAIGRRLGISTLTVSTHLRRVYSSSASAAALPSPLASSARSRSIGDRPIRRASRYRLYLRRNRLGLHCAA